MVGALAISTGESVRIFVQQQMLISAPASAQQNRRGVPIPPLRKDSESQYDVSVDGDCAHESN
jgi:hypothetical protein